MRIIYEPQFSIIPCIEYVCVIEVNCSSSFPPLYLRFMDRDEVLIRLEFTINGSSASLQLLFSAMVLGGFHNRPK